MCILSMQFCSDGFNYRVTDEVMQVISAHISLRCVIMRLTVAVVLLRQNII